MNTRAFSANSAGEFSAKLKDQLSSGFKPSLAIVFSSVSLGVSELCRVMGEKDFDFIGCSSCGEILSGHSGSPVIEGSSVTLLWDLDRAAFSVKLFPGDGKSPFEVGCDIGGWGRDSFADPSFVVLGSGLKMDGEQMIRGLLSVSGPDAKVYGGLAGDDGRFQETLAFTKDGMTSFGAVALLLDNSRVEVKGIAPSGWVGLGARKTITRAEGNVVYTIDHESALAVYKCYLDVRDEELPGIGVEYPMLVLRDDGTEVLRAIMGVEPDTGALIFAGSVPEKSKVRFSSSPGFEVLDFVKSELKQFHERFSEASLLLLFSCMARHGALGPMVEDEINEASRLWKAPLVGFFTYGEIGENAHGKCDFYNETFALMALRMRDSSR
ncbi:MAG: FIST N-terminal domain-containing protein [bacterium]|nr:FIST C-terminal domain-containing protein [Candidatus Sumerlaeota bacterium]